jgi:hypothetical protein
MKQKNFLEEIEKSEKNGWDQYNISNIEKMEKIQIQKKYGRNYESDLFDIL